MREVKRFLKSHGMNSTRVSLKECTTSFLKHAEAGLSGEKSSIKMLPAYLSTEYQVPMGKPVAVIDAGGTNFRTATVTFTERGAEIKDISVTPMPGAQGAVTWEEFISSTAETVIDTVRKCGRAGFCFSYPAEITPRRDGRVIAFTKQVMVSGAKGRLVCSDLVHELEARGMGGVEFTLLNDTSAALMGGKYSLPKGKYGSFLGLVCGTGVNVCCELQTGNIPKLGGGREGTILISMESGGFSEIPRGDFDLELDESTSDPGDYLHEKAVGGAYMGELVRLTLRGAAREGLFSDKFKEGVLSIEELDSADADRFASNPNGESPLAKVCGSDMDKLRAFYIINNLTDRAARLVCSNLCSAMILSGLEKEKPAAIIAEGAKYHNSGGFRCALNRHMFENAFENLGCRWNFVSVENVNLIGAAAAALQPNK